MALIFLIIFLAITLFIYYHFYHKLKNLPPGPMPLPFVGNLLSFSKSGTPEQAFLKWRRQYGPVFTYWLGNLPVVAIAEYQQIVDTMVKDAENYVDRQHFPFERAFRGGDQIHGVISSSGHLWREQRRFALQILRDFGLNKNLMQERILDEIMAMFGKLNRQINERTEVDLLKAIDIGIGSIINNLVFGYRLDGDKEPEFWEIKNKLDEHMKQFGNPLTLIWISYPHLLGHIPPFKQIQKDVMGRLKYFFAFFEKRILEHQQELADGIDSTSEPKDYVEAFLKEMRRREAIGEEGGGGGHYFTISQLSNMCFDLWIAGQETTSNMLAWTFAFLLNSQSCLDKIYAELDAVIGGDRLVVIADRQDLPYTNAVLNETLRLANILPFNIRRLVSNDVSINGHSVPKGTCVVPEISAVLFDETIFPEPTKFKPERFLDEEGRLKRCDQMIAFSLGKRQCLGESLARMELFLFTANILNQYRVMPGKEMPSMKRTIGAVNKCTHFTCRMEKRK